MTTSSMLTEREAAKVLGCAPGTLNVWRATRRYPLPYFKIGKAVRYRLGDLKAFLRSCRVSAIGRRR